MSAWNTITACCLRSLNKPWKNFRETQYGRPQRGQFAKSTLRPDTIVGIDPPFEEEQPPPVEYSAMTMAQRRQAEVLVDDIATIVALNVRVHLALSASPPTPYYFTASRRC